MLPTLSTFAQEGPAAAPTAGGAAATVAVSLALILAAGIWVRCSRGRGAYGDVLLGGMFVAALAGSSVIAQVFTTANDLVLQGVTALGQALGM